MNLTEAIRGMTSAVEEAFAEQTGMCLVQVPVAVAHVLVEAGVITRDPATGVLAMGASTPKIEPSEPA